MKTAIVTGASRGIGLATAKKFLNEGWRVVGTCNTTAIPMESPYLIPVELDLSSRESIDTAVKYIYELAPEVDVLVNSAGIILDAHNTGAHLEKIRATFEVDLFGVIDLTERLLFLLTKGAHIVNVDSLYGAFSFPIDDESSTGYRMVKAALNMYTRTLAFRLRHQHIAVSSLDPGWVKTDMGNDAATATEKPDREPEDAANDIYALATSTVDSGYFWRFGKKREW